ncbi:DUF1501 domain-containing protein [uncultured Brevundimonas sp.]|uniref:DUF1501 domain-containing protein n=1 Tax=uncultured Brevundimonas sp. TaxID=213418 RepID=UPI0026096E93|nr:DUF1501 domain-containing protein [uncultured Brevundimonas sp.]
MSTPLFLTRRLWLAGAAGVAVTAHGRMAWGAALSDRPKLVVIIARGAMDGLSVVVPHGDRDYAAKRGVVAISPPGEVGGALPLDSDFGIHPAMARLHGLAVAGQARFAPAVAIPARLRSHFDAQDVLESGSARLYGADDGWLNRALSVSGGRRGLAVGSQTPLVLRGPVQTASWTPGGPGRTDERVAAALMDLYADDPLLGPALTAGLEVETQAVSATEGLELRRNNVEGLGEAVARFMIAEEGPDVVTLSLDGYDTHARQGAAQGVLANQLRIQDRVIGGLRDGLGETWARTVIVVATEFGRTVRANGTGGTDHGTGSALILAGGALRPGGIVGDWPGLSDGVLFEGRDLAPTADIRSVFKGVLRDHMGLDRAALDTVVFPDSADAPGYAGLV